ncbi:MAG: hypothetical protein JNK63_02445 [Chthonomonas sp.]|nr:hypothetical protein [Chthonomonas sp.]
MSVFQSLLDEYEVVEDTFDVSVPAPRLESGEIVLTFKSFKTAAEADEARKSARKLSNACLLYGDPKAAECQMHGPIKEKLPATRDDAFQIALLTVALAPSDDPIPFLGMVRLCANRHFFDHLWGAYQQGQRTVISKMVEVAVERAKKNSLADEDSSSEHSATSDVPSDS